ncbi:twin-arginine translocation pathway signal protein [Cognatishimia sp. F0-27]|uniref:Acg family FMN-binding oxidoreductase n=1 Tax=Cognatishimia sp. F0-27 TaxID=2816855 RepID=UPI001D0CAF51|nr:twin-arginine translocation pathway signal protein [Cognatishimia sp. F0-27]MCC1491441.1 twin-arginine translocation pathway signal protein [Cognatishimia sp. F0-27]
MTLSRRKALFLVGGGAILAASGAAAYSVTRNPQSALAPWSTAGAETEIRRKALSYALLAPNPHNRQPWIVDLATDGEVTLSVDTARLLPATDPFSRQITIGLGCFLELMRMAAAEDGYRVTLDLFPEGEDAAALDRRPVARAQFIADPAISPDPLFAHVMNRRSLKEPYDTTRAVDPAVLDTLAAANTAGTRFGGTVDPDDIARFRALSREALRIEIETPHTYRESVDLFRIGHREVDANPDGIDFTGPMFESLRLAGLFNRDIALDTASIAYNAGLDAVYANTDTAMGHIWISTPTNTRTDQIISGADWIRLNLAGTAIGLSMQPLSQALQEYPEMDALYAQIHETLVPDGGTLQMFARIGYGPDTAPSPRWPLDAKIARS